MYGPSSLIVLRPYRLTVLDLIPRLNMYRVHVSDTRDDLSTIPVENIHQSLTHIDCADDACHRSWNVDVPRSRPCRQAGVLKHEILYQENLRWAERTGCVTVCSLCFEFLNLTANYAVRASAGILDIHWDAMLKSGVLVTDWMMGDKSI
jgi:hypothetical protein